MYLLILVRQDNYGEENISNQLLLILNHDVPSVICIPSNVSPQCLF